MNKTNKDLQAEVLHMDIEELWRTIQILKGHNEIEETEYNKILLGINIDCDIRLYLEHLQGHTTDIRENLKSEKVWYNRKEYSFTEWQNEWTEREALMRTLCYDYFEPEPGEEVARVSRR